MGDSEGSILFYACGHTIDLCKGTAPYTGNNREIRRQDGKLGTLCDSTQKGSPRTGR